MRKADLKVGEHYVSNASPHAFAPVAGVIKGYGHPKLGDYFTRTVLTVLDVPAKGLVTVKVQGVAGTYLVDPRYIAGTVADNTAAVEAKAKAAVDKQAQVDAEAVRRQAAQARVLELLGDAAPYWAKGEIKAHDDYSGVSGGSNYGRFTVTDLAPLLERAYSEGYSAAVAQFAVDV